MKRTICALTLVVLGAATSPTLTETEKVHLEALRQEAAKLATRFEVPPLPEGLVEVVGNRYAVTLYDPFTQKTFRSDALCILGEPGDLTGFWVSAKDPDNSGLWVQWGHEVWIWGSDVFDAFFQISMTGRLLREKEITGRYTLLDFDDEHLFGAFRMRQRIFGSCKDFQ